VHLVVQGELSAIRTSMIKVLDDSVTLLGVVEEDVGHINWMTIHSIEFNGSEEFSLVCVVVDNLSEGKELPIGIPIGRSGSKLVGSAAVGAGEDGDEGQGEES